MGKTGKWIRNLLTGKKETKIQNENRPTTPISTQQPTTPKEKRRWSFRRSSAAKSDDDLHTENDTSKKHAPTTDSAPDPVHLAAAKAAAAAVIPFTPPAPSAFEEACAVKIQSLFRAYLARKALNALKGLVKLQALVRGHLVRKQATATLRCMQALVSVQARARAQRIRMSEETKFIDQKQHYYNHRKSTQENRFRPSTQDLGVEENIKIVEVDLGDYKPVTRARSSYSNHSRPERTPTKQENPHQISPSPSAITDTSRFEEHSFGTTQSSPQCYSAMSKPDPAQIPFAYPRSEYAESLYSEYPFYPNYMANTESSRAKVRSQSAPKQRPVETFERQPSKRRPSIEGRNVPRAVRMQRSSSHVGSTAQNYQYPWSIKLDKSAVSLKDSECGSTSTVLTNYTKYCTSLVGFDVHGSRY